MLHLTTAQCIKATKDGVFKVDALNLSEPLSFEDIVFITKYLRITTITGIDFSFVLTQENSNGLELLSESLAEMGHIKDLIFRVTEFQFHCKYKGNPDTQALGFLDDYKIKKINNRVYKALTKLTENKPHLAHLNIGLGLLETPATKSQAKKFARNISQSPLVALAVDIAVKKESQLPILASSAHNHRLKTVYIGGCTYGANVLDYLKNTRTLTSLIIEDMDFSEGDLETLNTILHANPMLTEFRLARTNLGQFAALSIFEQLRQCLNIKMLGMSENNLSLHNVDSLCAYVSDKRCTLHELDLSRNAYTSSDMSQIAAALEKNETIEKLIIDGVLAENEGVQSVIRLLHANPRIKSISMAHNFRFQPDDKTMIELCTLLADPMCKIEEFSFYEDLPVYHFKTLSRAILSNNSLRNVDLNYEDYAVLGVIFQYKINVHLGKVEPVTAEEVSDTVDEISTDSRAQISADQSFSDVSFFREGELAKSPALEAPILKM